MPLVVLPSHKSHLDYLVISYLFYTNGGAVPHIAAGSNLNFFPLGNVFRRAGAFFIRRSFKQDEIYARTLRAYLLKLLKEGHTVEFFIEGGRSRTGKLLKPRYGLLGHVVDAVAAGQVHDVALCPTAVGYEVIVEGQSYARELSGGNKTSENVGQLFGAATVLRERFGRVHVSFSDPLSLRELLESRGVVPGQGFATDADRREALKRVAYRILGGINGAVRATASSVVAFALLGTSDRGVTRATLRARVGALVDYLLRRGIALASGLRAPLAVARLALLRLPPPPVSEVAGTLRGLDGQGPRAVGFGAALSAPLDEALALFLERKLITRHAWGGDNQSDVIAVIPERRALVDYYKNYVVHAFAREGIVALAVLVCRRNGALFTDRLQDEARFLSSLLRNEFVFDGPFEEAYRTVLEQLNQADLLRVDRAQRIEIPPEALGTLHMLASAVLPIVEGYSVAIGSVVGIPGGGVPQAELTARLLNDGERLWHTGALAHREAVSSVVLDNALEWLVDRGFGKTDSRPQGRRTVKFWNSTLDAAKATELRELERRVGRVIARV